MALIAKIGNSPNENHYNDHQEKSGVATVGSAVDTGNENNTNTSWIHLSHHTSGGQNMSIAIKVAFEGATISDSQLSADVAYAEMNGQEIRPIVQISQEGYQTEEFFEPRTTATTVRSSSDSVCGISIRTAVSVDSIRKSQLDNLSNELKGKSPQATWGRMFRTGSKEFKNQVLPDSVFGLNDDDRSTVSLGSIRKNMLGNLSNALKGQIPQATWDRMFGSGIKEFKNKVLPDSVFGMDDDDRSTISVNSIRRSVLDNLSNELKGQIPQVAWDRMFRSGSKEFKNKVLSASDESVVSNISNITDFTTGSFDDGSNMTDDTGFHTLSFCGKSARASIRCGTVKTLPASGSEDDGDNHYSVMSDDTGFKKFSFGDRPKDIGGKRKVPQSTSSDVDCLPVKVGVKEKQDADGTPDGANQCLGQEFTIPLGGNHEPGNLPKRVSKRKSVQSLVEAELNARNRSLNASNRSDEEGYQTEESSEPRTTATTVRSSSDSVCGMATGTAVYVDRIRKSLLDNLANELKGQIPQATWDRMFSAGSKEFKNQVPPDSVFDLNDSYRSIITSGTFAQAQAQRRKIYKNRGRKADVDQRDLEPDTESESASLDDDEKLLSSETKAHSIVDLVQSLSLKAEATMKQAFLEQPSSC